MYTEAVQASQAPYQLLCRSLVVLLAVVGCLLAATALAQSSVCQGRTVGLIAERHQELDGFKGPMGCALEDERPVGGGRARAQRFSNGEIVWTPNAGERMVVAAYQDADNIVVSWGDTRPKGFRKFLVRFQRGAAPASQADVTEYVSSNRGFFTLPKPIPGTYDVVVKGCNNDCEPEWTHPVRVVYAPPAAPIYRECRLEFQPRALIGAKWAEKGGAEGPMGCPIARERVVSGASGMIQEFANGAIAFSPDIGEGLIVLLHRDRSADDTLVFEYESLSPFALFEPRLVIDKDNAPIPPPFVSLSPSAGRVQLGSMPVGPRYTVQIRFGALASIPVSVRAGSSGASRSFTPPSCDVHGNDLIRAHWKKVGTLGCPLGPARAFPGRNGQVVDFERGQIVASPELGADLTVAAWQEGWRIVVDWGPSQQFVPSKKVLLRAVYEGVEIGQDEINKVDTVRGYTLKRDPEEGDNDSHLVTRRGAGEYSILLKGCDSGCQPVWSIPVTVQFRQPVGAPIPKELTSPKSVADALRGKAARARVALDVVANNPRPLQGSAGNNVGDDETYQMMAMLELVSLERQAGLDGNSLRRRGRPFPFLAEVENALRTATIYSKTGTNCNAPGLPSGEFDTALKGYMPIIYRYGALLAPDVRFRLHYLLSKTGPHDTGDETSGCLHRETENHRWMTDSSRYLSNQLWLKFSNDQKYNNRTNGMRKFIFRRLTEHLEGGFEEYNARPYARYTWQAIQNLYDYAEDEEIRLAAQSILDVLSAKTAVYTNDGRAQPPFRRLSGEANQDAYADSADRNKKAMMLFAAPTLSMDEVLPANGIEGFAPEAIVMLATSRYQPPDLVLDLMINHEHRSYYQIFRYAAGEVYASQRDFLISGGGTPTVATIDLKVAPVLWGLVGSAAGGTVGAVTGGGILGVIGGGLGSVFGLDHKSRKADRGLALRTVIIPTGTLSSTEQFIRFDASAEHDDAAEVQLGGLCVAPNFACGRNPLVPPRYQQSQCAIVNGPWTFVDFSSPACRRNRAMEYGFFAAVFGNGTPWGFFEAVPRADLRGMSLSNFAAQTMARNGGRTFRERGENTYTDFGGATIRFNIFGAPPIISTGRPGVDAALTARATVRAVGTIINSPALDVGPRSFTITNPGLKQELAVVWDETRIKRIVRETGRPRLPIDRVPATAMLAALGSADARLAALRGVGIDETTDDPAGLRQWMMNAEFTPYPAIGQGLLDLLGPLKLRRSVSIDVVVFKYEQLSGGVSPRRVQDVDPSRLQRAIVATHNERYGENVSRFTDLLDQRP